MSYTPHKFIAAHLPDAWLYEGCILYIGQNGHLFPAKGFVVQGGPMSTLSKEHLAYWRMVAQATLNAMEINTHLDFYWTVENNYDHFLSGHRQEMDKDAPALAKHLLDDRVASFERQQLANQLRYRKLYVFVNLEPPPSKLRFEDELRRRLNATDDHKMLLSEWKAARLKLEQVLNMVRHPFEAAGMTVSMLSANDYRRIFRKLFSPHHVRLRTQEPAANGKGNIWADTILSDFHRKTPFLHFDEHFHAFVSMASLPSDTTPGFLKHLFNLPHPDYAIKFTMRTTDKQQVIKDLQSDYGSKKALQKDREKKGKIVDVQMETQAEEIRGEIQILTQTPQQVFDIQAILHLWHPDENELRLRVDEAVLHMGYCNGMQGVLEQIAAPEALRACLPGWTREDRLDRFQPVKSVNAADSIPAHTDFIGTGRPQMLFPTPEGGLMAAHVFSRSRPFHNVTVGETGGGKTFLMNSIVTQLIAQGLKSVSVISTKNEFGPLMAMYNGVQISFTDDNPVFLNPCMISGEMPNADELAGMKAILETIFGDEPVETERKVRESRILKAIKQTFEKHGPATRNRHLVETFREGWDHDDMPALKRLAVILEPYANGGIYGEYFDSDTRKPLDLSNPFKFFDFSKIQKNRNLSAVMMMALTIGETIRLSKMPRHHRKALILDECWAFVNSNAGGDFIENALRVNRAFNCAVFLSTQELKDFLESSIAHVIMNNCHNFWLLRAKNHTAIELLRKELHLTKELADKFPFMPDPSEVGYSQFIYVHRADRSLITGAAINRVSPPEAILYSTSPDISQLRDHALAQGGDPWETVCKLAKMTKEEIHQETERLFAQPL
ncbi:MAG: ATP-binding protein [Verrucomicrobiae bacterium]|nr:ATP-binding protein [Verrucomicrobiae bacterium]